MAKTARATSSASSALGFELKTGTGILDGERDGENLDLNSIDITRHEIALAERPLRKL